MVTTQDCRRNSPSVITSSPADSCRAMASRTARSSVACGSAALTRPARTPCRVSRRWPVAVGFPPRPSAPYPPVCASPYRCPPCLLPLLPLPAGRAKAPCADAVAPRAAPEIGPYRLPDFHADAVAPEGKGEGLPPRLVAPELLCCQPCAFCQGLELGPD